jgi:hypothetical protein
MKQLPFPGTRFAYTLSGYSSAVSVHLNVLSPDPVWHHCRYGGIVDLYVALMKHRVQENLIACLVKKLGSLVVGVVRVS